MKIVDRAVKKVYRFNCPNCQSRLEGESKEFEDIGGKISKFSDVWSTRRMLRQINKLFGKGDDK